MGCVKSREVSSASIASTPKIHRPWASYSYEDEDVDANEDVTAGVEQAVVSNTNTTDTSNAPTNASTEMERKDRPFWNELLEWDAALNHPHPPPTKPSPDLPIVLSTSDDQTLASVPTLSHEDNYNSNSNSNSTISKYKLHSQLIQGQVDTILPPTQTKIRIMISSTFTDYSQERNTLLQDVLPYLQLFGSKHGIQVELSEMRWGISDHMAQQNRTTELCLKEIQRCKEESIGPFFCLMLGNKYGYRPVPSVLSVEEYEKAIARDIQDLEEGEGEGGGGVDTGIAQDINTDVVGEETKERDEKVDISSLIQEYYHLDENLAPPAYVFVSNPYEVFGKDDTNSHPLEQIGKLLNQSKSKAVTCTYPNKTKEERIKDEQAIVDYFDSPSITEQEAMAAYLENEIESSTSSLPSAASYTKRVMVYHRHIETLPQDESYVAYDDTGRSSTGEDVPSTKDEQIRSDKLKELKRVSKNVTETGGGHFRSFAVHSLDQDVMKKYLDEFANDFCYHVVSCIQQIVLQRKMREKKGGRSAKRIQQYIDDGLIDSKEEYQAILKEISSHHNHARQIFVGREAVVQDLANFCMNESGGKILVGPSGTGKTSLMAKAALTVKERLLSNRSNFKDTTIVLRFLGRSPSSSTSEGVCLSMLRQLSLAHPKDAKSVLTKDDIVTSRPSEKLLILLRRLSSVNKRVIFVLDAIDQLDALDPGRENLQVWLPPLFGVSTYKNISLLISTLPNECLEAMQSIEGFHSTTIPPFSSEEGSDMLDSLCRAYKRNLETGQQRNVIIRSFENSGRSTLALAIAFSQSLSWRSWEQHMKEKKSNQEQISSLFEELKLHFGSALIKSALSHLTLSPGGVSEDELQHFVSTDEKVLKEAFQYHKTPDGLVPMLQIIDILLTNKRYLVQREVDGVQTYYWYHRSFWESAQHEFCSSVDWTQKVHSEAIDIYSKQPDENPLTGAVNMRKLHQIPYRYAANKDWNGLGSFLENNPWALWHESGDQLDQVKFAGYWRLLNDNQMGGPKVEEVLSKFISDSSASIESSKIFVYGDFLKVYFETYDVCLEIYRHALSRSGEDLLNSKTTITNRVDLDCMSRIGDTYTRKSNYKEAHRYLSKAYNDLKITLGQDHSQTLQCLTLLTRLAKDMGLLSDSLEYDNILYERSILKFGDGDERVADAARQLARTHYLSGRYPIAIGYYEENHRIRKMLYGNEHPQTAIAINCVAMANKVLGNYDNAIRLCEEAYAVKERLYGVNHSDTAVTIDNLGSIHHLQGNFEKAKELYDKAWKIKKETLLPKDVHADTIMMYGQLGRLFHDFGYVEEALPFLEDNLRLRVKYLEPEDHPQIAVAKNPLAALYVDLDRNEEGLQLALEGLELRRKKLGSLHPYTAFSLDTVSLALLGLGRIAEAQAAANESLKIRIDILGESHFRTAQGQMTLAKIKSSQDLGKEAIEAARRAQDIYAKANLNESHPFLKRAEVLLGDLLEKHEIDTD